MLQMRMGDKQPRQRMNYGGEMKGYAEGDEIFMPSNPNQIAFSNETKAMENSQGMMYGGEMKRYANGGEIEAMLRW
jgi:hypothetical protein